MPAYDSGADEVAAYLNHVLNYLGVIAVGSIGIATQGEAGAIDAKEPEAQALGKKLVGAIRDGFSDPTQEKILAENRGYFRTIVEKNREMRQADYEDWVRKGWMD